MTFAQASAFLLVGAMMALFVWGRLRHDLVAMLALLAGGVLGIVPYGKAFSGFSRRHPPVVIGSPITGGSACHFRSSSRWRAFR